MIIGKIIEDYLEQVGGIFSDGDIDAIPYNHWKKDYEWLVMVSDEQDFIFIPVSALTAREACTLAISIYKGMETEDE